MAAYFLQIYRAVATIMVGMAQTIRHLFQPAVTLQYPDERWELPVNARAQLFNNVDDCIGCYKCARICPVDCIYIDTVKAAPDEDLGKASTGNPIRQHVVRFDIDMFKCCYCDLCTTVCPTECLYMTTEYETSVYNRDHGVYHFSKYSPELARRMIEEEALRDAEAQKAKAAARAAKAAGEGREARKRREETEQAASS